MPKKKSVRRSARDFLKQADALMVFCDGVGKADLPEQHVTWAYELAIIKLSVHFEHLILHALVGAINNDTAMLSETTGVIFPKHLTDEVCEYIITRNGYLDFHGRSGLIDVMKRFVADTHYLVQAVKKDKHRKPLDQMLALRNFAAHESRQSKKAALQAIGATRIASAGSWLKCQGRFRKIAKSVKALSQEIQSGAPY